MKGMGAAVSKGEYFAAITALTQTKEKQAAAEADLDYLLGKAPKSSASSTSVRRSAEAALAALSGRMNAAERARRRRGRSRARRPTRSARRWTGR
jgi:hypothetical protein